MTKKVLIGIGVVVVAFIVLAGAKALQIKALIASGAHVMPPEIVTTAEVKQEEWQPVLGAVGSVTAVQGIIVSAEQPGVVREISFESGAKVEQGALLVRIDSGAEEAQMRAAEADAELARLDFDRAKGLGERRVIAQSEWDSAQAKLKQMMAQVENMKTTIDKKTIRAPFTGRLGIRDVNLGQYVNAGTPIVSLQSLDSVFVNFSLPQQRLSALRAGMAVRVTSDTAPGRTLEGVLTAINPDVDAATRNVSLQATLENPEELLRPGVFVRIEVVLPQKMPVLTVPATAVSYAPYGDSVFVVEEKADEKTGEKTLMLRQQFVRLGEERGDFVTVIEGLKPGETVASSGVFKLRNAIAVKIDNTLAPKPELNPKPPQT